MPAYKVVYAAVAVDELLAIREYYSIERLRPDIAERVIAEIHNQVKKLAEGYFTPSMVLEEPWLTLGVRRLIVGDYRVFFIKDDQEQVIKVGRIVHVARDLSACVRSGFPS